MEWQNASCFVEPGLDICVAGCEDHHADTPSKDFPPENKVHLYTNSTRVCNDLAERESRNFWMPAEGAGKICGSLENVHHHVKWSQTKNRKTFCWLVFQLFNKALSNLLISWSGPLLFLMLAKTSPLQTVAVSSYLPDTLIQSNIQNW